MSFETNTETSAANSGRFPSHKSAMRRVGAIPHCSSESEPIPFMLDLARRCSTFCFLPWFLTYGNWGGNAPTNRASFFVCPNSFAISGGSSMPDFAAGDRERIW